MVKISTVSQKLEAVKWAETKSVSATARNFVVDPKRIREWKEKRAKLGSLTFSNNLYLW